MLDPQVDAVREMTDETAERIATLGVSPSGTPRRPRRRPTLRLIPCCVL
jgi:DNA-binding ferritin-like protein